jgi:ParB family transcriptional regulator, chromosome partitioning protein
MKTYYGGSEIGIFERLPVKDLRHPKMAVRDSVGDLDGLVESIRAHGLLEPIVVRPHKDSFEVVAGNRRLEACKRLRKKSVACHIVSMDDATSYEKSLIENIQRQNLNPIEEAVAFRRYVDDLGFGGVSKLARTVGKSESYVSRRISLLDLPESIKSNMEDGTLSLMLAQELIPLPKHDAAAIARLAVDGKLSRNEVRDMARAARAEPGEMLPFETAREASDLRRLDRALNKATTLLRVSMMRLDATIESLEEEDWVAADALLHCRREMHLMMDQLIRLRLRSKRKGSKTAGHFTRAAVRPG